MSSRDQSALLHAQRALVQSLRRKLFEERVKTQEAEADVTRLAVLLADQEKEHRTLQYNVQLKQMLIFTKTECLERKLARVNKDNICLREDISGLRAKVESGEEEISSLEAKVERGEKDISSLREDNSSLREDNSSLKAKVERGEKDISSLKKEMENFAEVLARHGLS